MFNLFKKEKEIKHDWRFGLTKLTIDHKKERRLYQCEDCGKYKEEIVSLEEVKQMSEEEDPNILYGNR